MEGDAGEGRITDATFTALLEFRDADPACQRARMSDTDTGNTSCGSIARICLDEAWMV